jgi:hypothetical protein
MELRVQIRGRSIRRDHAAVSQDVPVCETTNPLHQ